MRISDYDLESLRNQVVNAGGFQVVIAPIYPALFPKVHDESHRLHDLLMKEGIAVLLYNKNQKPRDMFKAIDFLRIPHRLTLSGRSLEVGVYEYFNLETELREKIKRREVLGFLETVI